MFQMSVPGDCKDIACMLCIQLECLIKYFDHQLSVTSSSVSSRNSKGCSVCSAGSR
jgi:Pyruvate/2-oxoacid:ferredoxin oxidoreductase delta subunit